MATTHMKGQEVRTVGDLPAEGTTAPRFTLTGSDLADIDGPAVGGGTVVLNVFPSVDTATCAMSVRRFNEAAAGLEGTTVLCVSQDLPFAQARFCGAEGITDVVMGSAFRSDFGETYGLTLEDGPMRGLLARAVLVIGADGTVLHSRLVPEISEEPDYAAALAVIPSGS